MCCQHRSMQPAYRTSGISRRRLPARISTTGSMQYCWAQGSKMFQQHLYVEGTHLCAVPDSFYFFRRLCIDACRIFMNVNALTWAEAGIV